jgi:hypothetical protein
MLHPRVANRVTCLIRKHGVFQRDVTGAYDSQPLRSLEFLLHEVAHWVVLGQDIHKVPTRLSRRVSDTFENIPAVSSDSLEIDTSLVAFLAGYQLGLWTDPTPIVRSCRRNLRGSLALGSDEAVLECFRQRWSHVSSKSYRELARRLALWFRPRARLLPTTGLVFGV